MREKSARLTVLVLIVIALLANASLGGAGRPARRAARTERRPPGRLDPHPVGGAHGDRHLGRLPALRVPHAQLHHRRLRRRADARDRPPPRRQRRAARLRLRRPAGRHPARPARRGHRRHLGHRRAQPAGGASHASTTSARTRCWRRPTTAAARSPSPEHLAGKRVGVQTGSVYETEMQRALVDTGLIKPADLVDYADIRDAIAALQAKSIDFVVMDAAPAQEHRAERAGQARRGWAHAAAVRHRPAEEQPDAAGAGERRARRPLRRRDNGQAGREIPGRFGRRGSAARAHADPHAGALRPQHEVGGRPELRRPRHEVAAGTKPGPEVHQDVAGAELRHLRLAARLLSRLRLGDAHERPAGQGRQDGRGRRHGRPLGEPGGAHRAGHLPGHLADARQPGRRLRRAHLGRHPRFPARRRPQPRRPCRRRPRPTCRSASSASTGTASGSASA